MKTPTENLVLQTENAIKQYVQNDCERSLPVINSLEDTSYQLWVESNCEFLDASFPISCTSCSDDESWWWDEECITERLTWKDSTCSQVSSCNLDGDPIRSDEETGCSSIYLTNCGSETSEGSENRQQCNNSDGRPFGNGSGSKTSCEFSNTNTTAHTNFDLISSVCVAVMDKTTNTIESFGTEYVKIDTETMYKTIDDWNLDVQTSSDCLDEIEDQVDIDTSNIFERVFMLLIKIQALFFPLLVCLFRKISNIF